VPGGQHVRGPGPRPARRPGGPRPSPDVRARLVELDEQNLAIARSSFAERGLDVELLAADAALTDSYVAAVPAGVVLTCGVFGNISDADVARTIAHLPGPAGPGRPAPTR